jgi:hypothetical protein
MNLPYVFPRLIRHFLPERLTRFLLLRSLIIRPGLETADPRAAVRRYAEVLRDHQLEVNGKRILIFGYGGRFDVGVELLQAGAGHVVLYDKYARPDDTHNRSLAAGSPDFVEICLGQPRPRPGRMTLLGQDIGVIATSHVFPAVDLVVSNSVFEHVEDVEGATDALAHLTRTNGLQIHFVDLRDHFFRYPFEMLRYKENDWRRWLNPTSNHNRLRIWDYRRIFGNHFGRVEIAVLQRDPRAFDKLKNHIRPEFASGNLDEDSATLIVIVAAVPRN